MTTRTPMIEWSMATIYAIWHASKVFPDGKVVRLCQMRYETNHTEGEPPVGATVCSMCAAGLTRIYCNTMDIIGRAEENFLVTHDEREPLYPQEYSLWQTMRDTLGRS